MNTRGWVSRDSGSSKSSLLPFPKSSKRTRTASHKQLHIAASHGFQTRDCLAGVFGMLCWSQNFQGPLNLVALASSWLEERSHWSCSWFLLHSHPPPLLPAMQDVVKAIAKASGDALPALHTLLSSQQTRSVLERHGGGFQLLLFTKRCWFL